MSDGDVPTIRYQVVVGNPTTGEATHYKTKRGALNAARRVRDGGQQGHRLGRDAPGVWGLVVHRYRPAGPVMNEEGLNMASMDETGELLEPCPKCGTTSVNCPITADQGLCAYDDMYSPDDDEARAAVVRGIVLWVNTGEAAADAGVDRVSAGRVSEAIWRKFRADA